MSRLAGLASLPDAFFALQSSGLRHVSNKRWAAEWRAYDFPLLREPRCGRGPIARLSLGARSAPRMQGIHGGYWLQACTN